jgi:hypothetical protein
VRVYAKGELVKTHQKQPQGGRAGGGASHLATVERVPVTGVARTLIAAGPALS